MNMQKWEPWEVALLEQYAYAPMREIIEKLPHRNRKTIYWKLSVLGFHRQTYKRYSEEEDAFIKDNSEKLGNRAIAKHLNRTEKSITKRMIILGIKRSEDALKTMRSTNAGVFKKGRKSEKTFAEGELQLAYDARYNYKFYNVKIGKKFVRFSRYLYEMYHNVKLKKGDVIIHLDGNSMNVLKDNLKLVTRLELMRKNIDSDEAFVKRIFRVTEPDEVKNLLENHSALVNLKRQTIQLNQTINGKHVTAAQS